MIFSAAAMMLLSHKTGYHDSFDVCRNLKLLFQLNLCPRKTFKFKSTANSTRITRAN